MAVPAIQMRNITKQFGTTVANNSVDFDLKPGEIHALLGENGAGKTTLMNILYGLHRPDEGQIIVNSKPVVIHSPHDAIDLGMGMVHQHFMLVPTLTVAENCALGRDSLLKYFVPGPIEAKLREISQRYGLAIDPRAKVEELSVGVQQRVEIVRALARGAEVLILDEPTAVLTPQEARDLLAGLQTLVSEGKSVVFITHKLKEVLAVSHRVTVLRQGMLIKTLDTRETNEQELALYMIGRPQVEVFERTMVAAGPPVLTVQNLRVLDDRNRIAITGLSFDLHEGEILGVAGVDGNGQAELAQALAGLRPIAEGTIKLNERALEHRSPESRIKAGVGHVPEDRQRWGLFMDFSIAENLISERHSWRPFAYLGFLNPKTIGANAVRLIGQYDIRPSHKDIGVHALSGGNRQRVVVARAFSRQPKVLIVNQPTRGLDVAATTYIRQQILSERDRGAAILLISADLDEVIALSDRIAVMYEGRFVDIVDPRSASIEDIGSMMLGISVRKEEQV